MKPFRNFLVASVAVVLLWGGYRIYRAHANLVTLNVRNMDVRRVISKLEWQTWERIVVSKNVGGRVTLNVHSVPLEEVLNIVGLQTDSRWTHLYPIYSTSRSLTAFNHVLQGDFTAAANGWSALQQLAAWQQAGLGGFANTLRAENKLVSAQLVDKDIIFTALALSRFSKAQIVPEDDTKGLVNLKLQQISFDSAVAKVAKQVHRKWTQVYTLQPLNSSTLVRQTVPTIPDPNANPQQDTNQPAPAQGGVKTLPPDRALEALVSTMTPEERQQTLDQIASAGQGGSTPFGPGGGGGGGGGGQQMQGGGASPAAQAAQAAAQQDMESRIENRLKNGTIDQRISHDRRVLSGTQKP